MPRIRTNKKKNIHTREDSLDILRGLAVIFMVLAHTIAFIHTKTNPVLNLLQNFGDTVCFTVFLLVSGASSYIAYINISGQKWRYQKSKLMKRTKDLLIGYYIVALLSSLQNFTFPISIDWAEHLFNLMFFIEVPGYTEFLLPFIVFSIIIVFARKAVVKILQQDMLAFMIGLSLYCISFLLYWIDVPDFLIPYKSLFTGFEGWYRFPILQYTVIFLLGLLIGKYLQNNVDNEKRKIYFKKLSIISLVFILLSIIIKPVGEFPYANAFNRWPPNISFLLLGLLFSYVVFFAISIKIPSVQIPAVKNIITSLGKHAFTLYIYHIVILQIYNYITGKKYNSPAITLLAYTALLIISYYLPNITTRIKLKFLNLFSGKTKPRKKEPYLNNKLFIVSILLFIISITGFVIALRHLRNTSTENQSKLDQDTEIKGAFTEESDNLDSGTPTLYGQINREWILKSQKEYPDYGNLTFSLTISGVNNENLTPYYKVLNTEYTGDIPFKSGNEYETELNAFDISIGTYQIQAYLDYGDYTYESNIKTFYISYPVYVVWTMDWEGTDAKNEELDKLNNFANKYSLPITQFFNPRIYITDEVSSQRCDYLTNWILERKQKGDEIGMHLHMHYEVPLAAGVEARVEPHWTDYLNNGHDVPCSEYTQEEFTKILIWAKSEFQKQGLGTPLSFRAGGWFADMKVLKALENTGFQIDSSGRSYYIWGNNKIEGHWRLSSKTQPYQPSLTNQNSHLPSPNLSIWEFPNNGADSWFYKSSDLIQRFKDNYTGGVAHSYKVVTYLTHPHAFSKDELQLTPLFDFIESYSAKSDSGPVIYTTLIRSYNDIVNL